MSPKATTQNQSSNILYTTHCPVCEMVETRLKEAGIPYTVVEDKDEMKRLGFVYAPMFYCAANKKYMIAKDTLLWISKQKESEEK